MEQNEDQLNSKSISKRLSNIDDNNRPTNGPQRQQQNNSVSTATFSIATPAVTTILPMTESISDTSFMLQTTSYTQDCLNMDKPFTPSSTMNTTNDIDISHSNSKSSITEKNEGYNIFLDNSKEHNSYKTTDYTKNVTSNSADLTEIEASSSNSSKQQITELGQDAYFNSQIASTTIEQFAQQPKQQNESNNQKMCKKRNKITKKSTKLDAKSKLEKSRQSARECRARKKLRYQYLEDLVTNREKAVVKLREELNMFCELSKQIDSGSISDKDKRFLIDQTKENNGNN